MNSTTLQAEKMDMAKKTQESADAEDNVIDS